MRACEWYEISNWARPGEECRHNECYWTEGDYLAIGCAAHGHTDGRRWWNVRTPERYIERIAARRVARSWSRSARSRDPARRSVRARAPHASRCRTAGRGDRRSRAAGDGGIPLPDRGSSGADGPGPVARQRHHGPGARRIGDAPCWHSVSSSARSAPGTEGDAGQALESDESVAPTPNRTRASTTARPRSCGPSSSSTSRAQCRSDPRP